MVQNPYQNALLPAPVGGGYSDPDYWIWCGSVVQGEDGAYHMFASRWPKDLGFGANWLFNCEIVRASSKNPEGPYTFQEVVLGRRGRTFFDGMERAQSVHPQMEQNLLPLLYGNDLRWSDSRSR